MNNTNNNFLNLFVKGIFVGIANIIPGVSGGTIAVVLRIFDTLIEAVNNFFKNPMKYIKFLFPIVLGSCFGILLFSKLLENALLHFSMPTNMFFVGLVTGSIPLIYGKAKEHEIKNSYYVATFISFAIVVTMAIMKDKEIVTASSIELDFTWITRIFISSIIAGASMIIPGISGSFVMVLLGIYNIILVSVSGLIDTVFESLKIISNGGFFEAFNHIILSNQFLIICISAVGLVIGIVVVSKLIDILLKNAFSLTYLTILGLILGSIFSIFSDPTTYVSNENYTGIFQNGLAIAISFMLFIIGFFIAYKLGKDE